MASPDLHFAPDPASPSVIAIPDNRSPTILDFELNHHDGRLEHYLHSLDGAGGDPKSHHADFTASGEGWKLEVRRHDDQDTEWVVYVDIDDGYALTPTSFLAVTDAYKRASAFAATLNGHPAVIA